MIRKSIAVDMDNVIADTATQLLIFYERYYGIKIAAESIAGVSEREVFPDNAVSKLIYKPGFFRTMPVIAGAQQALAQLIKNFDVYIVSSATEFPHSLAEKMEWLNEHFPFITWRNIVFCGDKGIIQTDYMIDDHIKNLDSCRGRTFLFTAAHNIAIEHPRRVNSWNEIMELILNDY